MVFLNLPLPGPCISCDLVVGPKVLIGFNLILLAGLFQRWWYLHASKYTKACDLPKTGESGAAAMEITPLRAWEGTGLWRAVRLPRSLLSAPPPSFPPLCEGLGSSGAEACTCVLVSQDGPTAQRLLGGQRQEGVRAQLYLRYAGIALTWKLGATWASGFGKGWWFKMPRRAGSGVSGERL